jgi:hypothetical protein
MRFRMGFRFPALSLFSAFIFIFSPLLICTAASGVARADTVKLVPSDHVDSFDAAGAASAQSVSPTMAQKSVEVAGLVADDNSVAFRAPMPSNRTHPLPTSIFSELSSSSSSPRARSAENGAIAFDTSFKQDQVTYAAATSESPLNFYGVAGFFFYGRVPASSGASGQGQSLAAAGSKPIDLGIERSGEGDLNSSDGTTPRHNGVAPRIKWPLRILTGEPVPVPEPSSLAMLGCGMLALALKRRHRAANWCELVVGDAATKPKSASRTPAGRAASQEQVTLNSKDFAAPAAKSAM